MRASSGGPIRTLFMLLPLVAFPILAITGVPQFAAVVASSSADEQEVTDLTEPPPHDRGVGDSARYDANNLFGSPDAAPASAAAALGEPTSLNAGGDAPPAAQGQSVVANQSPPPVHAERSGPPQEALEGWEPAVAQGALFEEERSAVDANNPFAQQDVGRQVAASEAPLAEANQESGVADAPLFSRDAPAPAANTQTAAQQPPGELPAQAAVRSPQAAEAGEFTFLTAVERLKSLGIRKYRLEPGDAGTFLFVCSVNDPANARITRRFEAEANDPLLAVAEVLEQVQQWVGQR